MLHSRSTLSHQQAAEPPAALLVTSGRCSCDERPLHEQQLCSCQQHCEQCWRRQHHRPSFPPAKARLCYAPSSEL